MKKYAVYGICCADDREFNILYNAVVYAEELGDKCEAIWEINEDGTKVLRDDLL